MATLELSQQPSRSRPVLRLPFHQQAHSGPYLHTPSSNGRLLRRPPWHAKPAACPRHMVLAAAAPAGQPKGSSVVQQAGQTPESGQRGSTASWDFELVEKQPLASGTLDLVRLEGSRMLRVWQPQGYSREQASKRPYPLLLLNDGQNLFEDRLSFSGHSWHVAETAAQLVASGSLPPFLVAGIDHAESLRSFDYLPYPPGSGPGNFRLDAAQWPGGGVETYCERVFNEVLPWLRQHYGAATDASRIAFGGSSFGGICTLWACMHYGHKFGAALVESPSLWIADELFLRQDLEHYIGPWPQRIFLGMGSKEYTGIRGGEAQWDELLVGYIGELAGLLHSRGLDSSRLLCQVGEGDTHNEESWARRLLLALTFLLEPWTAV